MVFVVMTSPLIRCSLSVGGTGACMGTVCGCVGVCLPRFISAGEHLRLLHGCNYRPLARSDTWLLPVRATASGVKVSAGPRADLLGPRSGPGRLSSRHVSLSAFSHSRDLQVQSLGARSRRRRSVNKSNASPNHFK